MLEENDALAAESASEEDENGARLEGFAGPSVVDGFADLMDLNVSKYFSSERACEWYLDDRCFAIRHGVGSRPRALTSKNKA